jgi:hypothetical protein
MPSHLIVVHLISLVIFSEDYKLQSSSSCNFFHHPATSILRSENTPLVTVSLQFQ